ncbi:hypothetical protein ACF0H5_011511 [Mactra antiquata]
MGMITYFVLSSIMIVCFAEQQSSTVGNITANVLGQSGKIRLYKWDNVSDGIVITFSAIAELTDAEEEIRAHRYYSFAQLDFIFSDLENTTYMDSNVTVTKFSFSAQIPIGGNSANLKSEVFLFTEDGNITVAGEEVEVTEGTMKFNVEIDSWTFCDNCKQGNKDVTGALLDFDVEIKGASAPKETSPGVYDMGDGATVLVPRQVVYDNTTTKDMPTGYPKLEVKGAKNIFTFRFERFNDSVFYDPTVDLGSDESGGGSTPDASDGTLVGSGIEVKVLGQSGKITVKKTDTANDAASSVTIEFDNLNEKDSDGNMINDNDHKVLTFANQVFTFSEPMDAKYPDTELGVKKISFQSTLHNQATVAIMMYIFKEGGDINNANETITVKEGDLKFNVEISNWPFCVASSNCPKNAIGESLDFEIVMKGKSKASKETSSGKEEYKLGNAVVTLSKMIVVDGVAVEMTEEPMLVSRGSKDAFKFRFPKFSNKILYDPTLTLGDSGNSASRASCVSIFLMVLWVLIKNLF